MDVLLAGPPARNPSELLDSDRMREVLAEAEESYDLVIIDTPPATVVSVTVVDPVQRAARVVVPDYKLSLAIGKEGQNARLAARLTGWRIDIRSDAEPVQTAPAEAEAETPS